MQNRLQQAHHPKASSISNRFFDFWLLGGASFILFLVMLIGSFFRAGSAIVQQNFLLIAPSFALLSVVCNNPHFIASYRFGYSRGFSYIFKYWFSLIVVPLALITLYVAAYINFDSDVSQNLFVSSLNSIFSFLDLRYRFGESARFGKELMSLSIWLMYFTLGWHYTKQIYGCMMVYNKFDQYQLSLSQKKLIKYSLLFLAFYQFMYSSDLMDTVAGSGHQDPRFAGIEISPLGLPHWLFFLSKLLAALSFILVSAIFIKKYVSEKRIPSPTFLVIWLSIYFWWIQVIEMPEFYYMAVPFFHSLQYLSFAVTLENKSIIKNKWQHAQISLRILTLFFLGFLFFQMIPYSLDKVINTEITKTAWFFMTSFAVFINIHHFFIDSVIWRLDQKQVKSGLFNEEGDYLNNQKTG